MSTTALQPVRVIQHISAPADITFDAWINPAIARQWLFASASNEIVKIDIDPRPGGAFSILELNNGEYIDHFGKYKQLERPNLLAFSLEVPKHFPGITQVTISIKPLSDGCELFLLQTGVSAEITEKPWQRMFKQLDDLLCRL